MPTSCPSLKKIFDLSKQFLKKKFSVEDGRGARRKTQKIIASGGVGCGRKSSVSSVNSLNRERTSKGVENQRDCKMKKKISFFRQTTGNCQPLQMKHSSLKKRKAVSDNETRKTLKITWGKTNF